MTKTELVAYIGTSRNYGALRRTLSKHHACLVRDIEDTWAFNREPSSFMEAVYQYLTPTDVVCPYGNTRSFKHFTTGYVCKKSCQCSFDKKRNTMLERYGVEHALQSREIMDCFKATLVTKYGADNLHIAFRETRAKTCLLKYGAETPLGSDGVRCKTRETHRTKYGCEYPFQRIDVQRAVQDTDKRVRVARVVAYKRYGASLYRKLYSRRWLLDQHHTKAKKISQIANELSVYLPVVTNALVRQGVAIQYYRESYAEKMWLDSLGIKLMRQHKIVFDDGSFVIADGYDSTTNTVYEFYGDFWHGNPQTTEHNEINEVTKCTFGELYNRTMAKAQAYKNNGYKLVEKWESNFKLLQDTI